MLNHFQPREKTESPAYLHGALTALYDDIHKGVALDKWTAMKAISHTRSWLKWLHDNRPGIGSALESAYLALLRSGEYRVRVQGELVALRSAIAAATGRSQQDVQDEFEARAARLREGE